MCFSVKLALLLINLSAIQALLYLNMRKRVCYLLMMLFGEHKCQVSLGKQQQ